MRFGNRVGRMAIATLLAVGGLVSPTPAPAEAAFSYNHVPAQFIAKLCTEAYGIAPPTAQWAYFQDYFIANGCSTATLKTVGKEVLRVPVTGAPVDDPLEFNYPLLSPDSLPGGDGHTRAARILALYRAALNREPTQAELNAGRQALNNAQPQTQENLEAVWNSLVNGVFDGAAFHQLVSDSTFGICQQAARRDPAAYGWSQIDQVEPLGTVPNTTMPAGQTCGMSGLGLTQAPSSLQATEAYSPA